MKSSNDKNADVGKPIKPVLIYCIIGAVVIFNVVLYLYVMDRLAQLDKLKEDLVKTTEQYQEVPIPDLMKDKIDQMERESQDKAGSQETSSSQSLEKRPAKSQDDPAAQPEGRKQSKAPAGGGH